MEPLTILVSIGAVFLIVGGWYAYTWVLTVMEMIDEYGKELDELHLRIESLEPHQLDSHSPNEERTKNVL